MSADSAKEEARRKNREAVRRYADRNREKIYARAKELRALRPRAPITEESRKKKREYMRAFRASNPDYVKRRYEKAAATRNADRETFRKRSREWHAKNRERRNAYSKEYDKKNAAKIYARRKAVRHANLEAYRKKEREWAAAHRDQINSYNRRRREQCAQARVMNRLRTRMHNALKRAGGRKAALSVELIGCSPEFLKGYLEARFKDGMSWGNHGLWHIDHRIPCAEFDLTQEDQQRQCFNYSNLQPLWSVDNLSKGSTLPEAHQAELI